MTEAQFKYVAETLGLIPWITHGETAQELEYRGKGVIMNIFTSGVHAGKPHLHVGHEIWWETSSGSLIASALLCKSQTINIGSDKVGAVR